MFGIIKFKIINSFLICSIFNLLIFTFSQENIEEFINQSYVNKQSEDYIYVKNYKKTTIAYITPW